MKKFISALLALALILSLAPRLPLTAHAATSGRYTYTVTNGEATITDYYIYGSGEIEIPSSLDGYKVTAIGDNAFASCEYLTGVVIPDGVTSIGDGAFSSCSKLKSVTIPQSVTSMGDYVFSHCYRLSSVTLPENVDRIGDRAFYFCYDLKSITIPEGVTSIGEEAFDMSGLTSITLHEGLISIGDGAFSYSSLAAITIPESVTTIGAYAFQRCWIRSITIPSGVTSISDHAFAMCDELVDVKIPSTVTSIGKDAFYDCDKLATITIPEGVVSINDGTFSYCDSLTNISLPASLTSFGTGVFDGCPKLSNVQIGENNENYSTDSKGVLFNKDKTELICVLNRSISGTYSVPEGVTRIGDKAFSGCSSLTGIGIPKTLTDIGSNAFQGCTALTGFGVNAENAFFSNDSKGVLFNKDKTELLYAPIGKMTSSYTIPAGVTRIGDNAFSNCSNLTGITIPAGVTSIGDNAFYYCSKLSKVTIPSGVTSIGNRAFSECKALTSITIPDSVTSIGYYAFNFCTGLTSVKLPGNLTSINIGMFECCYALKSITIPDSVTSIGKYAFHYSGLTGVTIPDGVTIIDDCAFDGAGLTGIAIPDSVTTIGKGAFRSNPLTSITIPSSITSISENAFASCSSLTSVAISESVTSIGGAAFSGCSALTSITIPNSVTSIGNSAFALCKGLTSIAIPESVTEIGDKAFYYCENLKSVSIPDSVISVGNNVFESCTKLSYNTYGDARYLGNTNNPYVVLVSVSSNNTTFYQVSQSTKIILEQAFLNCYMLTDITIPNSVSSIGAGAFNGCTALANIHVDEGNAYYCVGAEGALLNKDKTTLLRMPAAGISGSYTVADSVTAIAAYAFSECSGLTGLEIPGSVATVESSAFKNCDNLAHVWYRGSEYDRTNITVATGNGYFENATWHYNCCKPDSHIYDNACDMACNTCGYIRTVPDHIYTDSCDTSCDICGDIRSITHTYDHGCDTICNVCGEVRAVSDHVYTNGCDKTCNNCGYQRETTHIYDNADDLTCNECKESLPPAAPVLVSAEPDTVTLQPKAGLEYSMDGIHWQTSNTFSGLSHLTAYTFYQRVAGSATANVSKASEGLTVTTADKYTCDIPADFTVVEITDTSVTLNEVAGCEYSKNGRSWQKSPVFTGLMPGVQYTFYQRTAENSKYYASKSAVLHITTYSQLGTVTYDTNGGTGDLRYTTGTISTLKPTRSGYQFLGWALTPDAHAVYNPGDSYNRGENIVLYASWRKLCDNCGGDGEYFLRCYRCSGTGHGAREQCYSCKGKCYIYEKVTCPAGCYNGKLITGNSSVVTCGVCKGDGIWEEPIPCGNCNGAGSFVNPCVSCSGQKGSWLPCTECKSGVQVFTPEAPQAPQLQSVSNHTVVLVSYPNCQYRVSGGSWQDSNVFTGLSENTQYVFYQRYKSADYNNASSASSGLTVRTEESPRYNVTFLNWDGSVIETKSYRYGDEVTVPADPVRPSDDVCRYTFSGWDKEIGKCTGDATYRATYSETYRDYTVVFQDWNGTILSANTYHWGDTVVIPTAPERPGDEIFTYTFTGWDKEVANCAGDATYTAVYAAKSHLSGDYNNDGMVTDADAIYLLRHTLFPDVYPLAYTGDTNADGEINDADAIYLLRHTLFPILYPLFQKKP